MTQDKIVINQNISEIPDRKMAVIAESLYLLNLTIIPGIAFLALIWLFIKYDNVATRISGCHLRQTFSASIWVGLLLVLVTWVMLSTMNHDSPYTWMIVIPYFVICHSVLVLLGIMGLAKALAGKKFHYPIIGPSH
ncbi:hypothetical protein QUF74_10660 [Candidatus Halobeggiatoa sp. HSG11]|nr:hypothetical protein [Candidatus Halobeggiatoa sp. HSG11]